MPLLRETSIYFAGSLIRFSLSIISLPIITSFLTAEDFGRLGIVLAAASLLAVFTTAPVNQSLMLHAPQLRTGERDRLIGTLWLLSAGFGLAALIPVAIAIYVSRQLLPAVNDVPIEALVLYASATLVGVPWYVTGQALTIEGRSRTFTVVTLVGEVIRLAVTIAFLAKVSPTITGISVGVLASAAFLSTAGSVLAPHALRGAEKSLARDALSRTPSFFRLNLATSIRQAFDAGLLSTLAGLGALGLYTHASQYRTGFIMALNAIGYALLPIRLGEAREEPPTFPRTLALVGVVRLFLTLGAVFFITLGRPGIRLLTHDRLTDAHLLVGALVAVLLLTYSMSTHTAVLIVRDRNNVLNGISAAVITVGLIGALLLTIPFGIGGFMVALTLQELAGAILIRRITLGSGPDYARFRDFVIYTIVIWLHIAFVWLLSPSDQALALVWAGSTVVVLVTERAQVRLVLERLRAGWTARRPLGSY